MNCCADIVVSDAASPIQRAKSQPRNGRGEIFARTLGETARELVSSLNCTVRNANKTAQNRAKFNLMKIRILVQYQ